MADAPWPTGGGSTSQTLAVESILRMSSSSTPEPLSPAIGSIQPGGGVCYRLELAWGAWRRVWLGAVRPGYVRRMAALRRGSSQGAPHPLVDPRDLKFCRNQCSAHWLPEDDPFAWRGRLGLARWGLAEVGILGGGALLLGLGAAAWSLWLAVPLWIVAAWVVSFFRNPRRKVPVGPGLVVAPADGKVVEIARLDHDETIGGPAVRIGIFLSIFNVHINRAPARGRVMRLDYQRGEFLNALRGDSAQRNERMSVLLETDPQPRRMVVRQIAGQFARRIVCDLRPGEMLERGQALGMIKLGSRTELIVPWEPSLEIVTQLGRAVRAGADVLARYRPVAELQPGAPETSASKG